MMATPMIPPLGQWRNKRGQNSPEVFHREFFATYRENRGKEKGEHGEESGKLKMEGREEGRSMKNKDFFFP